MGIYASKTKVPVDRTIAEIQKLLVTYKADSFAFATEKGRIAIMFRMSNKAVRFVLPLPLENRYSVKTKFEQDLRQKYRALLLAIKAKLESVASGIETFEQAFMAHIVLPSGQTFGEWAIPQIDKTYDDGKMPPLLLN
jgi:hypothetical protein